MEKHWYLVSYDVRDPKRWRKIYERVKGQAERVQYSVFRFYATRTELEAFRYDIACLTAREDDLLVVHLCPSCARRVVDTSTEGTWDETRKRIEILSSSISVWTTGAAGGATPSLVLSSLYGQEHREEALERI
ncbi:MAG: CRISPR-associated endonuclease Cas2 [Chloracidobacterium sp.]|nr:CRISPR-associated endonuclease Cas2 [Chloracidobacterium sp.]MDW8217967.1 CRISPR-associated endonuclease Cas2 [Acidobacteriota bacterium]